MSLDALPLVLRSAIAPLHQQLRDHRVYGLVSSTAALRVFMAHHALAVWDFMSLLKRLQLDLTCVQVPWRPARDADTARLINEIVVAEESDVVDGVATSHYELYLRAMRDVGADTADIEGFVADVVARGSGHALARLPAAGPRRFVEHTLHTALHGSTSEVAASFLLGREDVIPAMFSRLLPALPTSPAPTALIAYLERHIALDGDDHGPRAVQLLLRIVGDDEQRLQQATAAAAAACTARLQLWDDIAAAITATAAAS
ncbi:MAG TPA: DUF3050 domain-containing protein [Myxococcota bacterium]